ncbi:MAG: stage III sporulation protein AG [Cellulosilyticaceae bacterium]
MQKSILIGLIAVAVGIMFTFIGPQLDSNKDIVMTEPVVEASSVAKEDKSGYDAQIEKRLEGILKQIEGVGNVEVMVTLSETKEIVLAQELNQTQEKTEEKDSTSGTRSINKESTQNKVVMADGNKPYVIKEEMPKISGVLVVAEGGDDSNIKNTIIQSVSSLLDIPVHKISVSKMVKN